MAAAGDDRFHGARGRRLFLVMFLPALLADAGEERAPAAPGVVLLDGTTVAGEIREVLADGGAARSLLVGKREEPIPLYEVQEIRFSSARKKDERTDFDAGPLVCFRDAELLQARVLSTGGDAPPEADRSSGAPGPAEREGVRLRLGGIGDISVPLGSLRAFRLREAHASDGLFEEDLERPPPAKDTVYVRRGSLLRVAGVFRGLSADYLSLERDGRVRRLRRQLVQGVMLAPAASESVEADPPAVFELRGLGRIPGYLAAVTGARAEGTGAPGRAVKLRLPGAPRGDFQTLPVDSVERISLSSDRVVFLSTLEPRSVQETPVLGRSFPYRKDLSVGGAPLTLDGRTFRRGLGVHSRCVLEYVLDGAYRSFAAVIGLDDSVEDRGSVEFRVAADGKEIFRKAMTGRDKPETVSLPMKGVTILRLEVDYGSDQLDLGDHADWADARVSR